MFWSSQRISAQPDCRAFHKIQLTLLCFLLFRFSRQGLSSGFLPENRPCRVTLSSKKHKNVHCHCFCCCSKQKTEPCPAMCTGQRGPLATRLVLVCHGQSPCHKTSGQDTSGYKPRILWSRHTWRWPIFAVVVIKNPAFLTIFFLQARQKRRDFLRL